MKNDIIGVIDIDLVYKSAKYAESLGGCKVPEIISDINDLEISGPTEIRKVTRNMNLNNKQGSILMSSGGTSGTPKLTYVNFEMGTYRTFKEWFPFEHTDVILNIFNAGRLWGSHYYAQGLAEHAQCTIIPGGPFKEDESKIWLPIFLDVEMNVICGNPTGIADFAKDQLKYFGANHSVTKIIWLAESWTEQKIDITQKAFPKAKLWGNYGSVETFIIATSTPDCDLGTLHLLPDQILELDDNGALLTRIGKGWTMPTIRYRLGDKIKSVKCSCGRKHALRVESRADDSFNLHSNKISINKLITTINKLSGVDASQIVLIDHDGMHQSVSQLLIRVVGHISETEIRSSLFNEIYVLSEVNQAYPESVIITICNQLERIDRTNKIPPVIWKTK
ncbi:hypothetical protein J1786_02615 [Rahnella sp. L72c]|uniref:AMP-dependent synthetase/ligase domain-containing protein n=1 Tax=Rahnella perminowiae TaxID=2816244 RepID=A0ABS6KVT6_9GAMM|nr:hypothetical protein [Rahnella perminowiae]MBU9833724.1 hypothetical protein [Rahnella perminowiae]